MKSKKSVAVLVMAGVVVSTAVSLLVGAQEKPAKGGEAKAAMPDLRKGLSETPGCLGVETARTTSGKNVIFAWLEDKSAVKQWYYSKMHRGVMKNLMTTQSDSKPLEHIKDDSGPILVIAAITYANEPKLKEVKLPISQISIELYQPLPVRPRPRGCRGNAGAGFGEMTPAGRRVLTAR